MKIYIVNASPRKDWNTSKMCDAFAKGAQSLNAKVQIINLYDFNYKGCYSCFDCKLKDGKSYGYCGYKDELYDFFQSIPKANGLVLASPIYFGNINAQLQAFTERLFFPFFTYTKNYALIAPKKLQLATIYTMNISEKVFLNDYIKPDYSGTIGSFEDFLTIVFTKPQRICSYNTYQFSDYSKYVSDIWDEQEKLKWQKKHFPKDLNKAFNAGIRMVEKILLEKINAKKV